MRSANSVKHLTILLIILMAAAFTFTSCGKTDVVKQSYTAPELKVGQTTTCPVMKTKFTVKENQKYAVVDGKKYYVCCPDCIDKIKDNPKKYLSGSSHGKEKQMEDMHKEHKETE